MDVKEILHVVLPFLYLVSVPFLYLISAAFILYFIFYFAVPSWKLKRRLTDINKKLSELKQKADASKTFVDPHVVRVQLMNIEPFNHLWKQYFETLHSQTEVINGEEKVVQWRETVPAEIFFSTEVLVDTPLRTEFFKHLPGLFTGIGIIGTFSGLIGGLQGFHVTDDPDQSRKSLEILLGTVSNAFVVSAFAISAAIVVTFLERNAVTRHFRQVEELCQLIDSMYNAGVGEEYLARLVKAAEESATQTTQLKDSLVADLKEMMTNLVERQIQASQANSQAMAVSITQSLTESLQKPMEAISQIVGRASESQGDHVQKALADVIAGFMVKLEEVFGGQITGLNAMMQETTASMRDTRDRFAELVANMSKAGQSAGEAMGEQLARTMEAAELRQQEINNQMRMFVEQIQELVSASQSKTSEKLNASLELLGEKVAHVVDSLAEQQIRANQDATHRQEAIATQAQATVSDLGGKVHTLNDQISEAVRAMKDTVNAMRTITSESVLKMNSSAENLNKAASDFSKAGQSVTGVFEKANQVANNLSVTATSFDAAAKTVQLTVAAYDKTRSEMTAMATSLQAIIETAKREAGLSRQLIGDLETAASKFSATQKETEVYLDKVSNILGVSFEKYTDAMSQSLNRSRTAFDKSLEEAVGMLRSTIEDLGESLSKLEPRR